MAKYIKKVTSFEDLKKKYRDLLRTNHPDNGGDTAVMQEINAEYDVLFRIWKDRHEKKTGQVVNETAESTRSEFYTQFGWKGRNYNSDRSLKTIAQIVRSYVKEKYDLKVSHLNIAQTKAKCGIIERKNYNKPSLG